MLNIVLANVIFSNNIFFKVLNFKVLKIIKNIIWLSREGIVEAKIDK